MKEELPPELELLARQMASRYFKMMPVGRFEMDDLRQEARLSALIALRTYNGRYGCKLMSFAYRVITSDMINLLKSERAKKRGGGWGEQRLPDDEFDDKNPMMVDETSWFEQAVVDRISAKQLVAEMDVCAEILLWAQLVEDGYTTCAADALLGGNVKDWGYRHCRKIYTRYVRRKLRERNAAAHKIEVEQRAQPISRSRVILPARCR